MSTDMHAHICSFTQAPKRNIVVGIVVVVGGRGRRLGLCVFACDCIVMLICTYAMLLYVTHNRHAGQNDHAYELFPSPMLCSLFSASNYHCCWAAAHFRLASPPSISVGRCRKTYPSLPTLLSLSFALHESLRHNVRVWRVCGM